MTSPAPQPAPLRPGQRAAKPAKALTPRQRAALALLDKPWSYGRTVSAGTFIVSGGASHKINERTLLTLTWREPPLADWDYSPSGHSWDEKCVITPAGRAALRAGSGGGRGRRR